MTAGTSQQLAVTPAWNPNKPAAPDPPRMQASGPSRSGADIGRSDNQASGSRSVPDVTADIVDIYDPDQNNEGIRPASSVSVPPDYPLDSLPRGASAHSLAHQSQHTDLQMSQRTNRNASNTSSNQRLSDPPHIVMASPAGESVVPSTSQRVQTNLPPHVHTATPAQHGPNSVTHSNVSVNVNQSLQSGNRQIRTHDLNVGVVSRLDPSRTGSSSNVLPDLVTQSQPPAAVRQISHAPRPSHPVDPRVSQSYRASDSHHRARHRDRRHGRSRRHSHRHPQPDEPCKESCMKCLAVGLSFRWILVVLSLLGVSCVVTGIVLAALHAAGNSFLFLAIMFIGLGVLLVVVVGVGWKCTPRGHEPLHALFNLGDFRSQRGRRHRSRPRREGRWYGGVMYPEFQFRRPPPSYNASMQDYQQQMAVAQQNQPPDTYDPNDMPEEDYSLPSSPPPSYRSRASTVRAGIQITFPPNQGGEYPESRPPTYRSHPSNTLQGHGRTRPSLSRDDENDDLSPEERAPEDVAFTGSSFIVDTNTNQNSTSIQIDPSVVSNQNVTVSVTTVSVTTQAAPSSSQISQVTQPSIIRSDVNVAVTDNTEFVDPVGDPDADHVMTQL